MGMSPKAVRRLAKRLAKEAAKANPSKREVEIPDTLVAFVHEEPVAPPPPPPKPPPLIPPLIAEGSLGPPRESSDDPEERI